MQLRMRNRIKNPGNFVDVICSWSQSRKEEGRWSRKMIALPSCCLFQTMREHFLITDEQARDEERGTQLRGRMEGTSIMYIHEMNSKKYIPFIP